VLSVQLDITLFSYGGIGYMFRINYLIHHHAFVQDKPQEHSNDKSISVHLFFPRGIPRYS